MAIIINEVSSEKINNAFNLIIENGGKVYKDNTFSVNLKTAVSQ
jgi:hypothetical protein